MDSITLSILEYNMKNFLTKEEKQHINENWRKKLPHIDFVDITNNMIDKKTGRDRYIEIYQGYITNPKYSNTCFILKSMEEFRMLNIMLGSTINPEKVRLILFNKDNYLQVSGDVKQYTHRIIEKFIEDKVNECPLCCKEVLDGRRCINCGENNCMKCILRLMEDKLIDLKYIKENSDVEKNMVYRECIYCKYKLEHIKMDTLFYNMGKGYLQTSQSY